MATLEGDQSSAMPKFTDSPLEGDGFEPSVPRKENRIIRDCPVRVFRTGLSVRATGSSYRKSQGPLPAVILRKRRA